jgi:hypothetical protein
VEEQETDMGRRTQGPFTAALVVFAFAAALAAQSASEAEELRRMAAAVTGASPDQFGPGCCQILQIPGSAFRTLNGTADENGLGYWVSASLGSVAMVAPVQLPTGSRIRFVGLYGFTSNGLLLPVTAELRGYKGGDVVSGPPAVIDIASVSSTQDGYNHALSGFLDYRVNNRVPFDPEGAQLEVRVSVGQDPIFGSTSFKAVDIWWEREPSPAPASATFADVPTDHPFFQFVEALADSGITAGCGGGNFCPDAPLTRKQMAAFLAKALGLYWPDVAF